MTVSFDAERKDLCPSLHALLSISIARNAVVGARAASRVIIVHGGAIARSIRDLF